MNRRTSSNWARLVLCDLSSITTQDRLVWERTIFHLFTVSGYFSASRHNHVHYRCEPGHHVLRSLATSSQLCSPNMVEEVKQRCLNWAQMLISGGQGTHLSHCPQKLVFCICTMEVTMARVIPVSFKELCAKCMAFLVKVTSSSSLLYT